MRSYFVQTVLVQGARAVPQFACWSLQLIRGSSCWLIQQLPSAPPPAPLHHLPRLRLHHVQLPHRLDWPQPPSALSMCRGPAASASGWLCPGLTVWTQRERRGCLTAGLVAARAGSRLLGASPWQLQRCRARRRETGCRGPDQRVCHRPPARCRAAHQRQMHPTPSSRHQKRHQRRPPHPTQLPRPQSPTQHHPLFHAPVHRRTRTARRLQQGHSTERLAPGPTPSARLVSAAAGWPGPA